MLTELQGRAAPPCHRLYPLAPAALRGGSAPAAPAAWRSRGQLAAGRPRLHAARAQQRDTGGLQNRELLVGDALCLVCFSLYKQVRGSRGSAAACSCAPLPLSSSRRASLTPRCPPRPLQITALILSPAFPGWLAPLHFSPERFSEFLSFALTLCGTWVGAGLLVGGYAADASADLNTAVSRTCRIWLASMPVCAAQLVLVTALEGRSLVGAEDWADVLPLAATGPGEPFVTAAGVLGEWSAPVPRRSATSWRGQVACAQCRGELGAVWAQRPAD